MRLAPAVQGLLNNAHLPRDVGLTLAFNFNPPYCFLLEFQCDVLLRYPLPFLTSNNRIILLSRVPGNCD